MSTIKESTKIFADNMRKRRKDLGYSQEKLGQLCNLHRTYIGGIEQYTRNPSLKNMEKIAKALKIDISLLNFKFYKDWDGEYALCVYRDEKYKFYPLKDKDINPKEKEILDKLSS